jgi:hypothetical protein
VPENIIMDAFATIFGSEFIIGYSYKITSPGAPEEGPSYASGGQPAEAFEFEVTFVDLRKDEGGGKETPVDCPAWLKAEIETWLYEDATGGIYAAIEEDDADRTYDAMDRRDELDADRRMGAKE